MLNYYRCWAFSLSLLSKCLAATWSPPALIDSQIPNSSNIWAAFDVRTKKCIATWLNDAYNPIYSIYADGNWSAPLPIDSVAQADPGASVSIACNSVTGEFLAVWVNDSEVPSYSIYADGQWSLPADIDNSVQIAGRISNAADPITGRFMAVWADINSYIPMYSIYADGQWSSSAPIDSNGQGYIPYVAADPITGRFMAVWADINSGVPMYSIYADGNWSPSAPIDSNAYGFSPYVAADPITGRFMAVWGDDNSGVPMYSIYADGNWSPSAPIDSSRIGGVEASDPFISIPFARINNPFVTFNPRIKGFLATWPEGETTGTPIYSIYTDGQWSIPAAINRSYDAGSSADIVSVFDPTTGGFLATWVSYTDDFPTYSIYGPVFAPLAPAEGGLFKPISANPKKGLF